jgi:hypothetical protein
MKNESADNIIEEFYNLFPCITDLIIHMPSFPTNEFIARIIDQFEYLSSVSFFYWFYNS